MFAFPKCVYVRVSCIVTILTCIYGQKLLTPSQRPESGGTHSGLTVAVGNVSLELLYYTTQSVSDNIIISPFTVWTTMTVISEGAAGDTLTEMRHVLRLHSNMSRTRSEFINMAKYLAVKTDTVLLENVNTIFSDISHPINSAFHDLIKSVYLTQVIPVKFNESAATADLVNTYISKVTHGKILKLVNSDDFSETQMILTSALYFKGQWTSPFDSSRTKIQPFYDGNNRQIGEVKMMYNRYSYPFASINELQARVLELPYGSQNRLSMLVILPDADVSLDQMFKNFILMPLDRVFEELRKSVEEFAGEEVDCYLPRFKIDSDLVLNKPLMDMGLSRVFDESRAEFPLLSNSSMYVSRVIHKATIEVTEEGTVAAAANAAEFGNRIGVSRFEANYPFAYLIVEKTTNAIAFGGIYSKPSVF